MSDIDDETIHLMWIVAQKEGMRAAVEIGDLVPRAREDRMRECADFWHDEHDKQLARAERAESQLRQRDERVRELESALHKACDCLPYHEPTHPDYKGEESEVGRMVRSVLADPPDSDNPVCGECQGTGEIPLGEDPVEWVESSRCDGAGRDETPASGGEEATTEALAREAYPQAYQTTPQATEGERQVGCEGEDGLLRTHGNSETCDVCGGEDTGAGYLIDDVSRLHGLAGHRGNAAAERLRRALTRERVPEAVRRLPKDWRDNNAEDRPIGSPEQRAYKDACDDCATELERALADFGQGVSNDWVLVPKEPTVEMTAAGGQEAAVADVYRAMIDAAPKTEDSR